MVWTCNAYERSEDIEENSTQKRREKDQEEDPDG